MMRVKLILATFLFLKKEKEYRFYRFELLPALGEVEVLHLMAFSRGKMWGGLVLCIIGCKIIDRKM